MSERRDDRTLRSREGDQASVAAVAAWGLMVLASPTRTLVNRHLPVECELRFGRVQADDVDVAIDDAKMSRRHARVRPHGSALELVDEGSSNGSFVNGERAAHKALVRSDIVRLGNTIFEVVDQPPRAAPNDAALIGAAPAFLAAIELADRVARSATPVLVLGETGTGKDLVSRRLHARSGRDGNFVAVNCAALPAELVESALFGHRKGAFSGATADATGFYREADGGTLFLDEIGELAIAHQAKLLRALDAGEIVPVGSSRPVRVDVRVVAATNVELLAATNSGHFRPDLYARLAGAVIRMPPLRARRGDILTLAEGFLEGRRLSSQAAERLLLHPWPRNVRELSSTMGRLALRVGADAEATRADVEAVLEPPGVPPAATHPRGPRPGAPAREDLVATLASLRGNVSRLAEHYGKDGKQIYRWLKAYGLDPGDYRS